MIPDRHDSSRDESSVEGVCIVISSRITRRARNGIDGIADKMLTLTVLEVIQENVKTLALNTVLLHNNAAAANDFSGVALTIDLAESSPGSKDLGVSDLDEVDFVLSAKSFDELNVLGFGTGLDEDAEMGLALIESLGTLAESPRKTVMNESVLQNLLQGSR